MPVNIVYTPGWEIAEEEAIMRRVAWKMRWLGHELQMRVSLELDRGLFRLGYRGRVFVMSEAVATPERLQAAARKLIEEAGE